MQSNQSVFLSATIDKYLCVSFFSIAPGGRAKANALPGFQKLKPKTMTKLSFTDCVKAVSRIKYMMLEKAPDIYRLRRNLSGVYLFDCLPHDRAERTPTCIEDCQAYIRQAWLKSLDEQALQRVMALLNEVRLKMLVQLSEQEVKDYSTSYYPEPRGKNKRLLVAYCDYLCDYIKVVAVNTGFCEADSEAAHPYDYVSVAM